MADFLEIRGNNDTFKFLGNVPRLAIHLLRDAIDDIGDKIEEQARIEAPQGDTGALKAHPIERSDVTVGAVEARAPLFGGGFAVRGPRGFIPGVGQIGQDVVANSTISLPNEPRHAIWVHNGTGIYGGNHTPIVPVRAKHLVYDAYGKHWVRRSVKGQQANPYLERAYVIINHEYVPLRIERLRIEIKSLT